MNIAAKGPGPGMRQLVDWSAALWAGFLAGIVFLLANMALSAHYIGSPWVVSRLLASPVLGTGVLPPPATFVLSHLLVALVLHLLLSMGFSCLIAYCLHRWGLIVGILGGAAFGLALYLINFYSFSFLFPWFFPMRSWIMLASHVLFGALAGGIYEALEVEEFVEDE